MDNYEIRLMHSNGHIVDRSVAPTSTPVKHRVACVQHFAKTTRSWHQPCPSQAEEFCVREKDTLFGRRSVCATIPDGSDRNRVLSPIIRRACHNISPAFALHTVCAGTSLTTAAGELSRSMGRIVMYEIKHINIEVILRNYRTPLLGQISQCSRAFRRYKTGRR